MDLLACGGEGHVLLRCGTHVDLVDVGQELLRLRGVCGGGVVCHAVQPAVPDEPKPRWLKPVQVIQVTIPRVLQAVPFSWDHAAVHLPQGVFPIHFSGVDHPAVTS